MSHEPYSVTRRQLLVHGAAVAVAAGVPGLASSARTGEGVGTDPKETAMEPKLVRVPTEEDLKKALNTASAGISEATHRAHLGLWQGYANKTNEIRKALAELDTDPAKGNQIYSQTRALKVNYAFAYGGYLNHNVYFDTIGGSGGPATGDLDALIKEAYGSYDKWKADLKITGISSRGWAYVGYDHEEQRIFNYAGDSQDTFPAWNNTLVLALDVYEHAYFLDFQTARAKYIDAYFSVIDWDAANARLKKALGK